MEQRRQADRLQRNRLAARVRAADHERAQRRRARDRSAPPPPGRAAGASLPRSRTSSEISTGAPASARESDPARDGQVDRRPPPRRGRRSHPRASPTAAESSRRIRSTSSRSAATASEWRLLGRRVERLDEERLAGVRGVVDDAGHAAPGARLHGEHGPAAALGDEILLQVLAQAGGRGRAARSFSVDALAAGRAAGRAACGGAATRCRAGRSRRPRSRAGSTLRAARARVDRGGELCRSGAASRGRRGRHARASAPPIVSATSRNAAARARRRGPRVRGRSGRRGSLERRLVGMSSSATASAVSAWRRATSPGSARRLE